MLNAFARHWRKGLAVLGAILVIALVHTAWPFLTYPETRFELTLASPLPAEETTVPLAGVAEVDITPAIGIPKFGYSAFATDSSGFRTRLKARAFYLHAPGSTPLALVQLDLGSGSLLLHRQVAVKIAAVTDVPAHGLSLMSTHTHTGPGNFLDSDFYNSFGTNRPGFDPKLLAFLTERISLAVQQAFEARRPARFATGRADAWGLTRNRSLPAWARNHGLDPDSLSPAMVYEAVNPAMHMLRIDLKADNGCFYPAGALTSFSVHGTAIPAFWDPYHGDVWAFLSRAFQNRSLSASAGDCQQPSPFPMVHGTVQATHGDNNPDVRGGRRGPIEAARIGQALADSARQLHAQLEARLEDTLSTRMGSRQLSLLEQPAANQPALCERAVVGAATAGAANDDEVFPISYLPFLKEGWPRRFFSDGCQGAKQWMLSKLQLAMPAERFPHRALLQIIQLNNLVLATTPWEVTLESGNRMRDAILEQLPPGDWLVEISSVANGYLGYATTPEEYSAQFYEGGHTLYGPGTVAYLSDQFGRLTHDLQARGEIADLPASDAFSLITRQYWPEAVTSTAPMVIEGKPEYIPAESNQEPFWRLRVRGPAPGNLALHEPLLAVQQQQDAGWQTLVTDEGVDLAWVLLDQSDEDAVYEARWYNPQHRAEAEFRFLIRPSAQALVSPPF